MKDKIKKIWNDSVGSKVIAGLILTIIIGGVPMVVGWILGLNFNQFLIALSRFFQTTIELSYLVILIFLILNAFFLLFFKILVNRSIQLKIGDTKMKLDDLVIASEISTISICDVDQEVSQLKITEFKPLDNSNLYYCLINVYDGKEAENIFISVMCKRYKIKLEGAYEIMGKWDLLIKFRYSGRTQIKKIIDVYEKELSKRKIIYSNNGFNSIDVSNRIVSFDVMKEINPFKKNIHRRFLHSTRKYIETRSQRGFMFIELHREQKVDFINLFTVHLGKHERVSEIVEFFSICRNEIIINFFMRCSQTSQLILLNNAVEEFLQENELDVVKHTFLCYTFNEPISGILN